MSIQSKLIAAATAFIVSCGLAVLAISGPAQADVIDINCVGTKTVTYNPGLLNTPRSTTISATATFTGCVSTSQPSITSGQIVGSGTAVEACTSLTNSGVGQTLITWNTGATSTYQYTLIESTGVLGNKVVTLRGLSSVAYSAVTSSSL